MSNRKVVDYYLAGNDEKGIIQWIKEGWQPWGSPFLYNVDGEAVICQALVKYEDSE